jgi:hypothetical protein
MEKDWNVFAGAPQNKKSRCASTKTFSNRLLALNELEKKTWH